MDKATNETIIKVNNLQVQFRTDSKIVNAVDNISFAIAKGETLGIVGESGSGKSVTSLALMGLIPNSGKVTGEIWFQEGDLAPINLLQIADRDAYAGKGHRHLYRGSKMAMIFQEPMSSLNPVYTIEFQLVEAICLHQNISSKEAKRKAAALLQEVKLLPTDQELKERCLNAWQNQPKNVGKIPNDQEINQQINQEKQAMLDRYPHELSGGQMQRVMIAMAISCNPLLLIADEPTTALDVTVQATILDLLRELRDRRGMAIMFITHDLGLVAEIADQVAVMYQGKIVEFGDLERIFTHPQHPYTKGLLACRPPLDRQLKRLPTIADFIEKNNPELANNIQPLTPFPSTQSSPPDHQLPLLNVCNLQVGFPQKGMFGEKRGLLMAVNDVSFQVYHGETLGLVGESGCGKSTLARGLLQLIPPTKGDVWFDGQAITPPKQQKGGWLTNYQLQREYRRKLRWLRRDMQIIFQDPFSSLNPRLTIGEAVTEPLLVYNLGQTKKEQLDRTAYLLERVGLNPDWIRRYPHEFSGGQRQRICIARALALQPKFIICDESVSALDVSVQAQVLNLLKELQEEFKLTYIFISHDLSVVKFMSDRIMVMNKGKIEEIDRSENIYYQPQTEYTKQLIASIPTGDWRRVRANRG